MPDPSELFTNVYVKGLGTEVKLFHLFICFEETLTTIELKVLFNSQSSDDNHVFLYLLFELLRQVHWKRIVHDLIYIVSLDLF